MGSKSESKMPSSKPEKPRSGGEGAVFSNSEEQKKKNPVTELCWENPTNLSK